MWFLFLSCFFPCYEIPNSASSGCWHFVRVFERLHSDFILFWHLKLQKMQVFNPHFFSQLSNKMKLLKDWFHKTSNLDFPQKSWNPKGRLSKTGSFLERDFFSLKMCLKSHEFCLKPFGYLWSKFYENKQELFEYVWAAAKHFSTSFLLFTTCHSVVSNQNLMKRKGFVQFCEGGEKKQQPLPWRGKKKQGVQKKAKYAGDKHASWSKLEGGRMHPRSKEE